MPPNTARAPRLRRSQPLRNSTPAKKPMMPMLNIWKGVHGPCEKRTLLASMVMAPTRKPVSPPKATPAMMVRAMTGLNWGSMKKAARPATPKAHSTAMMVSSRACGRRPSKTMKNGSIHSSITSRAVI